MSDCTTTSLRSYQERLVNTVKDRNAVVVLPTGAGKTLIAAAVVSHFLQTKLSKFLFLVPTRILYHNRRQHYASRRKEMSGNIKEATPFRRISTY